MVAVDREDPDAVPRFDAPDNPPRRSLQPKINHAQRRRAFNSLVRDECLNINIFWSLAQARVVINDWKKDYNQRLHSSLGYQPPAVYAAACTPR